MKRLGPSSGQPPLSLDLLLSRCSPEPNSGCWLWASTISRSGYARISVGGKHVQAHRLSYELSCGPIPAGLEVDHLCRVRCCVNPAHLEPVTRLENIRRGTQGHVNRSKTHCPKGHPYSGRNLYINPNGGRMCRACQQESWSRAYAAKKLRAERIKEIA